MASVLVIASEPVGRRMLGSAIRAYELARALAAHADVTLAAPEGPRGEPAGPAATFPRADARALRPLLARADLVVTQPPWPHVLAELRRSRARLVFDLYDPEPLENLELLAGRRMPLRRTVSRLVRDRYAAALADGDHLMCASEAQRALWLGMLLGGPGIDPAAYDADPTLRSRVDVVPFGLPAEPPRGPAAIPGVAPEDEVVLWNGGIWNWLDAPTAIRAAARLAERRPRLKLVFMAAAAAGPGRAAAEEARRIATALGVVGSVVHFHEGWVPYEARGAWLLRADVAVSAHRDHLETHFAFRTRLLDCFWAGVPVVCTRGDELAERVERDGLGATVPERDAEAVAAALAGVLDRGRAAYGPALAAARDGFAWPRVIAPLARWVSAPPRAPGRRRAAPAPRRARELAFRSALRLLGRWPAL